jgi:hypothetical protein
MKRVLAIVLSCGMLTFSMQAEILARGGGGGGSAARSGAGLSPSGGASRPAGSNASARPSAGGTPKAAARPSGGAAAKSAGAAQRPAQAGGAAGKGAVATQRPAQAGGAAGKGAVAAQRPAQAGGAAAANRAAGARPSAGQVNNFIDVPGRAATGAVGVAGAAGAGRPGGAAAEFLQGGGTQLAAGAAIGGAAIGAAATGRLRPDAGRPGTAGQNLTQNRPERIDNRGERQGDRDQRRDEVRNQYEQNNPGNFWQENPGWAAFAVTRPFAWASWGSVGSWCGYSGQPTSYSYGEDVYYSDNQVYSGDQPVATAEEYAEQAATIASSAPSATSEKAEWLPLGVFALTQDGQASGTDPTLYMQMAISKQGVISGTLKNTLTGKTQQLEGAADKQSQRVAWGVVGEQRPIMETGLSNLTQDASPALIHFADGQTQQWLMVRIPEPKG